MEIKSLGTTDFGTVWQAFNRAFVDYEMQLNEVQLQSMLKRRGFKPDLSFAAFDGNEILAFTLNGIGDFNGIPTAYDTGTGTLKEHRGKGLATQIFEYSIPYLREKKIKQYLLEVLQHNTKAISVYKKLGFEVTREFNYFMQQNVEINNKVSSTPIDCLIKQIDFESIDSVTDCRDFTPSWQNSIESIKRAPEGFISLGAFIDNKLAGYSIFEPVSGDITQLAVGKQNRRKGIATLLLNEMINLNKNDAIKIINTDIRCNSITSFLQAKDIPIKGKQFEMIKEI